MDAKRLQELASQVAAGDLLPDELVRLIAEERSVNLGYANLDVERGARTGVDEVVYGAGKTAEQIAGIATALLEAGQPRVLVTRVDEQKAEQLGHLCPELEYNRVAHTCIAGGLPEPDGNGEILILAAGTSDLNVAEEAAFTALFLGNQVRVINDVGVAGIHRLLKHEQEIARAQVIIAIAGMEGALASVVGGLASCPVIAVPTSVGYGANFEGVTALLAMINSCASGVSVVNIDNGFGAAFQASLINHLPGKAHVHA